MPASMPEKPWIWQSEAVIPSHAAAARATLDQLIAELARNGWPRREIFRVRLAVEEALVNAIKHGNRQDPSKQIHVAYCLWADRVRIEIVDEGRGFDPAMLPDCTDSEHLGEPRGRGVMLMRSLMSRVEFSVRGNQVILEKKRTEEAKLSPEEDRGEG
jgi:serine/threonine-protein kinase RsbW